MASGDRRQRNGLTTRPDAGVCCRAPGGAASDYGPRHAGDALLALGLGRPAQPDARGARITTAASSSSSLTLTFGWTQAVTCTASSAAITGNTTATTGSFMVVVRADAATALTYATTYASSGGTAMVYRIDVAVEQLI